MAIDTWEDWRENTITIRNLVFSILSIVSVTICTMKGFFKKIWKLSSYPWKYYKCIVDIKVYTTVKCHVSSLGGYNFNSFQMFSLWLLAERNYEIRMTSGKSNYFSYQLVW